MKFLILATLVTLTSCASQGDKERQQSALNKVNVDKVLVKGTEQVKVLGSPNTVSTNGSGEEVWGYLKSARNSNSSSVGTTIWNHSLNYASWGYLGGNVSDSKESTSDTTLIVYFDKNKRVTNHNFRTEMF
jgi:outer membrane protein assembly factor BamE (lipoprotein component of BamABCDE complex)